MACFLRVIGDSLDPDECAALFSIEPDSRWRKDEPHGKPWARRRYRTSGLQFLVSTHDGDFVPLQIEDALAFMRAHHEELRAVTRRPDVEEAFLDFSWSIAISRFAQSFRIPPELAALCGANGVGIDFSVYPCEDYVQDYFSESDDVDGTDGEVDNEP